MEAVTKAEKQDKDNAGLWIWWCLLDEIRTHFEQNPEDFAD